MTLSTKIQVLGLAFVVACFSSTAFADLNVAGHGNALQPPVFGENLTPLGEPMSFNYDHAADQSSLGTCTMNPMSSRRVESIIEEMRHEVPETHVAIQDYGFSLPRSARSTDASFNPRRPYYSDPDDPSGPDEPDAPDDPVNPDEPDNPTVPEPATLLIVGLGMVGIVPFAGRWRRKS